VTAPLTGHVLAIADSARLIVAGPSCAMEHRSADYARRKWHTLAAPARHLSLIVRTGTRRGGIWKGDCARGSVLSRSMSMGWPPPVSRLRRAHQIRGTWASSRRVRWPGCPG